MKSLIYILLPAVMALSSCAKYVQVLYPSPVSTGMQVEPTQHVFENDSIRIEYRLWAHKGIMCFVLKNKTNAPIYIDWKRSTMTREDKVVPYFIDKQDNAFQSVTVGAGRRGGRYYTNAAITDGSGVSIKSERISFIPPNSYVTKEFSNLTNIDILYITGKAKEEYMTGKKAYIAKLENSHLTFRNFITYSTTEDFKKEQYIDNEFVITKVMMMKWNDFSRRVGFAEAPRTLFRDDRAFYIGPDYLYKMYKK